MCLLRFRVPSATRRAAFVVLAASLATTASAQSTDLPSAKRLADSVRVIIEAAVDIADASAVDNAAAFAERALALYPNEALLQHYRAYALYREGTIVFGQNGSGRARPYFDKARDILERLVEQPTIPESYALLGSVYGMQIATAKVTMVAGMRLGPRSSAMLERAAQAAPGNPRVLLMQGIGAMNTPSTFGGGLDKAESYLKRAIDAFAAEKPEPPLPAWGLADAHVWLGQVYAKQKKRDAARSEFEAARTLQPRNGWITGSLLPSLDRIK
jgi:tetratricopeptide (TPR) repeat protein